MTSITLRCTTARPRRRRYSVSKWSRGKKSAKSRYRARCAKKKCVHGHLKHPTKTRCCKKAPKKRK